MKTLHVSLIALACCASSLWAEFEYRGHIGLNSQAYLKRPSDKHAQNFTLEQELELSYTYGNFQAGTRIYAQEDAHDLDEDHENGRSYARLDELFMKYELENGLLFAGKNIRFWGALEAFNVADTFTTVDFRSDLLDEQREGAWNVAYSYFTETGELSLIIKLYENPWQMSKYPYVYYFFPEFIHYDSDLKREESGFYPTLYLKYSGSTEWEYPLDYAFIVQHGYDSQRYFTSDAPLNGVNNRFRANAYLVDKALTYHTLVVDNTLFKLEASAAHVRDEQVMLGGLHVEDYYHLGVGFEHTLIGVYNDADLGLIGEYYRYDTFKHGDDIADDLALFQTFQNDIFVGVRYSVNDMDSSSLLAGIVFDTQYAEQSYQIEYETRLFDTVSLKADYSYINPSDSQQTAYAMLQEHQRIGVNFAYHF